MRLKNYEPLALIVADTDDLNVTSSVLQDAVAKVGDLAFIPDQRRFAFVTNRFVWEDAAKKRFGPYARVRAGVHFDDVINVRTKNIRMEAKDAVLNILSVSYQADEAGEGGEITLTMAGGGAIALTVAAINAEVRDLSAPWATQNKPNHGRG